jgi:hypothetical protein
VGVIEWGKRRQAKALAQQVDVGADLGLDDMATGL